MSKYDPLRGHLMQARGPVDARFDDLEALLGFRLPASARRYAAWWANSGGSHVQSLAWLEAGYRTEDVDVRRETVRFVPESSGGFAEMKQSELNPEPTPATAGKPSLFGSMKGTTIIMPGVDLSEPADPDWGKVYDDDHDPLQLEIDRVKSDPSLSTIGRIWTLVDFGLDPAEISSALRVEAEEVEDALHARRSSRGW